MTYQSFDGHGIDVASKRADDLDKKVLAYIADHPGCQVLELGSGAGGQSVRMALAGAQVTAVDRFDFSSIFAQLREEKGLSVDQLHFVLGDMLWLEDMGVQGKFAATVLQRTLHHVPYLAAKQLLTHLKELTTGGLYVSVTGLGSLVGDTYPGGLEPITERFCSLTDLGKEMFQIREPVCLYTQTEFEELLEVAGWRVDECWVSAFGNIKAVCSSALRK